MEIGQLVVKFKRDLEPHYYPYLGQVCLQGNIFKLLEGYPCKKPHEFSPLMTNPDAQIMMEHVIDGSGHAVERLDEIDSTQFKPKWFTADHGWKTARAVQASLEQGNAIRAEVQDIITGLSREVNEWVQVMEEATTDDIRFYINMEECDNPPEDLVFFVERDFAEIAEILRDVIEEIEGEAKNVQ